MIKEKLNEKFGLHNWELHRLSGGDINANFKLVTKEGVYFIKYNTSRFHKGIIYSDKIGLEHLNQYGIPVPKIIDAWQAPDHSALILSFLSPTEKMGAKHHQLLGQALASMHRVQSNQYGFDHSNYIGALPQSNIKMDYFHDFFWEERLKPQLQMAHTKSFIQAPIKYKYLRTQIENLVPHEKPTLIHGDLWNGNVLFTYNGVYFIDPSIYYGHRETDIAMMHLFGGFDKAVFDAYQTIFPLKDGWEERMDLFQLYYLLVHLNLFGSGYYQSVKRVLDKYK